ncbi:hypothetical protein NPS58_03940 [Pseudomonas putida]|uniref:hypothetical protein n=1 Tax=Pseudomonas putida TaxID=303 RepID=UPI0023632F5C|nr:hypothetical protein [Pseudomonas putida]MDD2056597.1 hypothetical protein [Pseudomonas putida]
MKLNSARSVWHDSLYVARDSQGACLQEIGMLGRMIQKTERLTNASHAAHQAVAGRIQQAIDTLPSRLKSFGNFMYSPLASDDEKEEAEDAVFLIAYAAGQKMYAKKFEKARLVAVGVLYRYRRMHQGGQSEGVDPCPTPEAFRAWLLQVLGLELSSEQWAREWGGFVQACFDACNDLDRDALVPVSLAIKEMKIAA